NPVSARLNCFIAFISSVGNMTMVPFSQITPHDGQLCRVSFADMGEYKQIAPMSKNTIPAKPCFNT
ncbi:MAG: hypothetical protein ACK5JI_03420, partial [Azonexus sp.]